MKTRMGFQTRQMAFFSVATTHLQPQPLNLHALAVGVIRQSGQLLEFALQLGLRLPPALLRCFIGRFGLLRLFAGR